MLDAVNVGLRQWISHLDIWVSMFFGPFAMVWTEKWVDNDVAGGCFTVLPCVADDGGFLSPGGVRAYECCGARTRKLPNEGVWVETVREQTGDGWSGSDIWLGEWVRGVRCHVSWLWINTCGRKHVKRRGGRNRLDMAWCCCGRVCVGGRKGRWLRCTRCALIGRCWFWRWPMCSLGSAEECCQ